MSAGFAGFPAEALTFFRQLKKNNNREWFQAHRDVFETKVKAPMVELVHALNVELSKAAPDYVTDPKSAIYRIYRDTRFSRNKAPYKTQTAASLIHRALEKHASAGLYVAIGAEEVNVGGGVYMPGPDEIRILREMFAEQHEAFEKLTKAKAYKGLLGDLHGEQLTRVPKGFPADHPAESLLRGKQWYFYVTLDPALAATPSLFTEVKKRFQAMVPVLDLMNAPLLAAKKREAARSMM